MNLVFSVSESGRSTAIELSRRLKEPPVKFKRALNSSPGRRVTYWIAPPTAFLPNSVPCGPRSTSIRSTSTTPSVYIPSVVDCHTPST